MAAERERTVTWSDPALIAAAAQGKSGLEFLQACERGEVPAPPIMVLLGVEVGHAEMGKVTLHLPTGEHLYNPLGSVHGGVIATLLDSAMGCAVQSSLAAGKSYTTLEFKISFARRLTKDIGRTTAEGILIQAGRQIALAEGRLLGPDGKLYATATTTCLILDSATNSRE